MNSKFYFFKGKCKWAKLLAPNKFGNWSIQLYPDQESYDAILKLKEKNGEINGILNVIKKDEDGYYVSFSRPGSKLMRGKTVGFAPPEVLTPEGILIRDVMVGNGSDVTVKIEVYRYKSPSTGFGTAARLSSVRVDNLVPFSMQRDLDPDQEKATRGLMEQPAPLF